MKEKKRKAISIASFPARKEAFFSAVFFAWFDPGKGGVKMRDFLSLNDYSILEIERLLENAYAYRDRKRDMNLKAFRVANLFYEPSTRTHYSFLSAEQELEMKIMDIEASKSSVMKGESLGDTLQTLKQLQTDCVVLRHFDYLQEKDNEKWPKIINAGFGEFDHPSQSLLDLMTIKEEFGALNGLKIGIVGDLKHSRVARSNTELFSRFGAKLEFVAPEEYRDNFFEDYGPYVELDDALETWDVVMLLRIQKERHKQASHLTCEEYFKKYGMNKKRYEKLKSHAIIMHPGPINRDVEVEDCLVEAEKSRYFQQIQNGRYARMAILEAVCTWDTY